MLPTKLILLPGLDGTGILFQPLLEALPQTISPVVHAYPGDRKLNYQDLVAMVGASLPVNEPFVLLGESFSGPIALMLAAKAPPGLRGVILCATFIRGPHWYVPRFCAPLVQSPLLGMYPAYARAKALLGGYSSASHLRTLARDAMSRVAPAVVAHRIRSVLRVDAASALRACPVPILYLQARRDRVVPARNLAWIRRMTVSLLAQDNTKVGVKCKRKMAGWDDEYLLSIAGRAVA